MIEFFFVVGCNNEHRIRNYSDIWAAETQRINFSSFLKGMRRFPDLPKCVYIRANPSWFQLHLRREYKVFWSLKIRSPNKCSLTSFAAKVYSRLSLNERGAGGSTEPLDLKATFKQTACFWKEQQFFGMVKRWVFYTTIEKILNKVCYRFSLRS